MYNVGGGGGVHSVYNGLTKVRKALFIMIVYNVMVQYENMSSLHTRTSKAEIGTQRHLRMYCKIGASSNENGL